MGTSMGPAPGEPEADSADGLGGDGTVSSSTKVANQDQHARSATRPQRPAPPGPLKPTRARRRPALIALGLALVALSVLGSVYLASLARADLPGPGGHDERRTRCPDHARGHRDRRAARRGGIRPAQAGPRRPARRDDGTGKVATADLKAGQLLTADSVRGRAPATGRAVHRGHRARSQPDAYAGPEGRRTPCAWSRRPRLVASRPRGHRSRSRPPWCRPTPTAIGDQTVVDVQVTSSNAAASRPAPRPVAWPS